MLCLKGGDAEASMVLNIISEGVACIFVHQVKKMGLRHVILCAERTVDDDSFAAFLANESTNYGPSSTADLVQIFAIRGWAHVAIRACI